MYHHTPSKIIQEEFMVNKVYSYQYCFLLYKQISIVEEHSEDLSTSKKSIYTQ
jgi:hypothetical protein